MRAPFNARILESQLDVGQVVSTGVTLGTMFSIESLEIAVPVSSEERRLIGPLDAQSVSVYLPSSMDGVLTGTLVRASASLDERTRLGTLFVAASNPERLTLGEFVRVEIVGKDSPDSYRLPAAALTSRDRLWVVENGLLSGRTVEVLGREAEMAVVRVFDEADGVVSIPPANAAEGLAVTARGPDGLAAIDSSGKRPE